jgi:hypothetical protein
LLRVDPERRFLSPPSKAGLSAVERVKKKSKGKEIPGKTMKRLQDCPWPGIMGLKKGNREGHDAPLSAIQKADYESMKRRKRKWERRYLLI